MRYFLYGCACIYDTGTSLSQWYGSGIQCFFDPWIRGSDPGFGTKNIRILDLDTPPGSYFRALNNNLFN
jgi:hypothetical protein